MNGTRGTVGVAASTTTLTLPDGTAISLADWIDDKYYGVGQFANGQSTPIEVFSAGRSQVIPGGQRGLSKVDTNIQRAGSNGLPKDYEMLVYGWGIKLVRVMRPPTGATQPVLADGTGALSAPPTLTTLFNVDRVTFCEYFFNGKSYSNGVMQDYPQGHGYHVFSTNTAFELAQNGIPSPRDRVALVVPVHEKEGLQYNMTLQPDAPLVINQAAADGGAALTFVDIKVYKYGLIKRPVV